MPVAFSVAKHRAKKLHWVEGFSGNPLSAERVLQSIWHPNDASCREMLQSSFQPKAEFTTRNNGFMDTVISAYNLHHNLIIRPDDVWIAILSQLNLYVNAHAEELRSKFVAHEGKMKLTVEEFGDRYSVDFGYMAKKMSELMKENIADPSFYEWILPSYTTTTVNDTVVCSVMMMSTLKDYFHYEFRLSCGIPSIMLLGEKQDYETILRRLDKLEELGTEPTAFAHLLSPILKQFVLAFDVVAQGGTPNADFWGRICHTFSEGSGSTYLSGWIPAFCCWNQGGKWQGPDLDDMYVTAPPMAAENLNQSDEPPPPLVYEGLRYPRIEGTNIPQGFCEVDISLDDNGKQLDCMMVAGHVGIVASGKDALDTLQPASEWFMFIKGGAAPPDTVHGSVVVHLAS